MLRQPMLGTEQNSNCHGIRMEHARSILTVFSIIVCGMVICGSNISCSSQPKVSLPPEFCGSAPFALGERLDKVRKWNELEELASVPGFRLRGNLPCSTFSVCYINTEVDDLFTNSSTVMSIALGGEATEEDGGLDSTALHIVSQIIETYGDIYKIADVAMGRSSDPSPFLMWKTDSCAVTFIYLPSSVAIKLSESKREEYSGYSFVLKRDLNEYELKRPVSRRWTKATLGLIGQTRQ